MIEQRYSYSPYYVNFAVSVFLWHIADWKQYSRQRRLCYTVAKTISSWYEIFVGYHKKIYADAMASAKCLVPVDTFRQKYASDSAGGSRAVFILGSLVSLPSEDVVCRRSITLSDEDKNTFSKTLALPPDRWTDLDAILARYSQDKEVSFGPRVIYATGNDISCVSVLAKLREFLKSSTDKDGGI